MERLSYKIEDSTIAELLGLQSFANGNAAILEIVKNAYDAHADTLVIEFGDDSILFEDDGDGMSKNVIRENWMHVGFSCKEYSSVSDNGQLRIQAGSKGVGRFALAYLGQKVVLETKSTRHHGALWKTNWKESVLDGCMRKDKGTSILISQLREKWTEKKILDLMRYLSRTYAGNEMVIKIRYNGVCNTVPGYYTEPVLGVNCLEIIRIAYDAGSRCLNVDISSDEFKDSAQESVSKLSIKGHHEHINMADEFSLDVDNDSTAEEVDKRLEELGSFESELYFSLSPTKNDIEKFLYKHGRISDPFDSGIVLYRNAFSIQSFDGSTDWIGLGARARKSPASPTHESGSWRVRANQVSGFVRIDRKENQYLRDLVNRQGLEENEHYKLLLAIIDTALKVFERYRQTVIREIRKKTKKLESPNDRWPIMTLISEKKTQLEDITEADYKQLQSELKERAKDDRQRSQEAEEAREHHRYDVRILNVLATMGLKSSAIAHEMRNDKNNIGEICESIRDALKEYGLWEIVSSSEKTSIAHQNIPKLLDENERLNHKTVQLINSMLGEIEVNRFQEKGCSLRQALEETCGRWQRDYAQLNINFPLKGDAAVIMPEDAVQVVFDNLILNSLQQNVNQSALNIQIDFRERGDYYDVAYHDDGRGLVEKYRDNPFRILDVHETSRDGGHGLGMWILNTTLINYKSSVESISSDNGFNISMNFARR